MDINKNSLLIKDYKLNYEYQKSDITINENININSNEINFEKNNPNIIIIKHKILENNYILGNKITYKLKAINDIGEGEWSFPLEVVCSKYPNKPGDIEIKKRLNKTSLILSWEEDDKIENNIETLGYSIYISSKIFLILQ